MLIKVGNVVRLGKSVCACCSLHIQNCRCNHDKTHFDTTCPNRHSTY